MARKKLTTTQRGLGARHRHARNSLLTRHRDGDGCEWCNRPMYRDRTQNYDFDADGAPFSGSLHADHRDITRAEAVRRGLPMPLPNRLLHGLCNLERGDGRDYLREVTEEDHVTLAMAWP
jgi:hypothetical protein